MPYAEVLALASYLLDAWTPERIESLRQRLRADLIELERPTTDKKVYFRMRRPCAFLEVEPAGSFRGACSIYSERPMACRLLYAITDPARCEPTEEDQTVGSPDFSKVLSASLHAIQVALGDPALMIVPMQAGLSLALDSLCDGMQEDHAAKVHWWFDRLLSWGTGENVVVEEI
jgi:Fe-S-cluster containining protein